MSTLVENIKKLIVGIGADIQQLQRQIDRLNIPSQTEHQFTDEEKHRLLRTMKFFEKKMDTDGDRLSDYDEFEKYNTNPEKADSDDDGINDKDEITRGSNPNIPEEIIQYTGEIPLTGSISNSNIKLGNFISTDTPYQYSSIDSNGLITANLQIGDVIEFTEYSNQTMSYGNASSIFLDNIDITNNGYYVSFMGKDGDYYEVNLGYEMLTTRIYLMDRYNAVAVLYKGNQEVARKTFGYTSGEVRYVSLYDYNKHKIIVKYYR